VVVVHVVQAHDEVAAQHVDVGVAAVIQRTLADPVAHALLLLLVVLADGRILGLRRLACDFIDEWHRASPWGGWLRGAHQACAIACIATVAATTPRSNGPEVMSVDTDRMPA
jgi:hypothetical protein